MKLIQYNYHPLLNVILFENFMLQVKLFLAVSNMDSDKRGKIGVGEAGHNGSVLEWP